MVSFIVFATLLGFMMFGMPIAISLALATTIGMLSGGYDLILIPQNMVSSVKSIELTAIPFFLYPSSMNTRAVMLGYVAVFCMNHLSRIRRKNC